MDSGIAQVDFRVVLLSCALYGGLNVQNTMPFGTPAAVKADVKHLIEECGKGGGYLLSPAHHIQSDTSNENIFAFYEAAKTYRP